MFGNNNPPEVSGIKLKKTDTYVHSSVSAEGEMKFIGSLHFDGTLNGDLLGEESGKEYLIIGKSGQVTGSIRANKIIVFGTINGSIYSEGILSLMPGSKVSGDIYYHDIDMRHGASVVGRFHHTGGKKTQPMEEKSTDVKEVKKETK